jgi:hypothetical protein
VIESKERLAISSRKIKEGGCVNIGQVRQDETRSLALCANLALIAG